MPPAARHRSRHLRRREDPDLLRGAATYTDDLRPSGAVHAAFLRSRYAHARIVSVDVEPARALEGVVAAFGAADLAEAGAPTTVRASSKLEGRDHVDRPLLVGNVARFAGDPVALVLADDRYAAADALSAIEVEYERLPAVTDPEAALELDLPSLDDAESESIGWAGGPASVDWEVGDPQAVDRVFDAAAHAVSLPVANGRIAPVPLETRSLLAEYDDPTGSYTLTTSTQTPQQDRDRIAESLAIPAGSLRVRAPAVGGGFGTKGSAPYPEEPLVVWAAGHLSRPVRWSATRTESMQTDHHGRGIDTEGELALDGDGRILGLRIRGRVAMGAYPLRGPSQCLTSQLLSGAYRVPEIHARVTGVLTNSTPLGAYRGAGRPEAINVVERLLDRAAAELELDPATIRRRNFIRPEEFPYETATGAVYDSGDYGRALDLALEAIDYEATREAQAAARDDGRYLGIGLSSYVENTSSSTGNARIEIDRGGAVTAYCGTADQGQGHATTFAALLEDELGVTDEEITVLEGDSAVLDNGKGTYGSRSAPNVGGALVGAARELIEHGRDVAADRFEVAPADVEFERGRFHVRGVADRALTLGEVVELADAGSGGGDAAGSSSVSVVERDGQRRLASTGVYHPENRSFSSGTHAAVVEVVPATGEVTIVDYVAVDDCGTQLNPMLVEGQVHGGVGQGIGQVLAEYVAYDDTGTLLTGSFQDYALARAADLPEIRTDAVETPSPWTPHGAKGVGEAGTIAAPPAVVNAVVDALEPLGVRTVDMPLTAERVWRAVRDADGG